MTINNDTLYSMAQLDLSVGRCAYTCPTRPAATTCCSLSTPGPTTSPTSAAAPPAPQAGDFLLVEQEVAGCGAGGAAADVGEVVGPGVHELEHVVAAGRVGHVQPHRTDAQVELGHRVQGVVVDRDERVALGRRAVRAWLKWLNGAAGFDADARR